MIKVYAKTDRQRARREWAALNLVARCGVRGVPAPLWIDEAPVEPAIGMSRLHGEPLLHVGDQRSAVSAVADRTAELHALPLTGSDLDEMPRVDSAEHYLIRLAQQWPQLLVAEAADPLAPTMRAWLTRWRRSGDAERILRPGEKVLSRGDGNLLNWMIDDAGRAGCVDFEYAGFSSRAFDIADLIEHISARAVPDTIWNAMLPAFGITEANREAFAAAQRTCALRWLALLWKRRDQRHEEFQTQLQRVERLNSDRNPYA